MPHVAQNLVTENIRILDVNNNTLTITGLSTTPGVDFQINLQRQSAGGATWVAASEAVAITEVGATGHYVFSFTPQNTGSYILYVTELDAATLARVMPFPYEILPAGAVFTPSFAQAFCAESDIERYAGLSFTSSSTVTSTEAAGFAEERAAVLMSLCASWGLSVTPSTVTVGSRIEDLLRAANAIGAALDAVIAWYTQVEPAENEKARSLMARWIALVGDGAKLIGTVQVEIEENLSSGLGTSHIQSGDTTARASENAPQDIGLQFRMGDQF